jgi:hypothetical protein
MAGVGVLGRRMQASNIEMIGDFVSVVFGDENVLEESHKKQLVLIILLVGTLLCMCYSVVLLCKQQAIKQTPF